MQRKTTICKLPHGVSASYGEERNQYLVTFRLDELVRLRPQKPRPKERIDYEALQQTYRRMLVEGPFSNKTELARHLGVSRVWVSRVLKGIK
jgi:hypothetical protein